ncbi:FmdB family zinc ribbon protein [Kocuria tytonis]|uniref:FmdB family transcriptional regulator n=1 Tax=Kocuria tytonis TaxID=2054280 RepID=A0A495A9Z2_9MICC|nr:FmdB family zinc ribbon protein [Kocuria tytonis]RKQ36877.1 FmdB family transcriptional regulator [Kocuria tytonis]
MPVYAYACKDCGHAFDIRQSFSDDALTLCPECGGTLRKKFNSVGVVFKGSGFYRNDARSDSATGGGQAPGAASSGGDAPGSGGASGSKDASAGSGTGGTSSSLGTSGSATSGGASTGGGAAESR